MSREPLLQIVDPVQEIVQPLRLAPLSVEAAFGTLAGLPSSAVEDERLARNPAAGAKLPAVEVALFVPMTPDEGRSLAHNSPEHVRAAVLLTAGTGLRQGEAFGLTVDRGPHIVDQSLGGTAEDWLTMEAV